LKVIKMNQTTEVTAMQATQYAPRTVSRIDKKLHLGPDSQVDDRVVYIAPTEPVRTDPFLLLSEDWFSTPGFSWHPRRGLETVSRSLRQSQGDSIVMSGSRLSPCSSTPSSTSGGPLPERRSAVGPLTPARVLRRP
jgi:hypothetical protein